MAEANAEARLRRGVDVDLIEVDSLRGRRIHLPRQDPRYSELELPRLVLVRSKDNGRAELCGVGWWGSDQMSPDAVAVKASPEVIKRMARRGDPSFGAPRKLAAVATARWWDVPIYARGFWMPAFVAAIAAAAAITGGVIAFLTDKVAIGLGVAALALLVSAEFLKAAFEIGRAAFGAD